MENLKLISIKGLLDVNGIFNADHAQGNHLHAKVDSLGRDYTSSRCLRYHMFYKEQPRQPATQEAIDNITDIAGSKVGLLRGYLNGKLGVNRIGPLTVLHAYTHPDYLRKKEYQSDKTDQVHYYYKSVTVDQGVSSKPKERGLKDEHGTDKKDTSLFSFDTAGPRKQILTVHIRIPDLQFLPLDQEGYRCVVQDEEPKFVENLNNTFKELGVASNLKIKKYRRKNAILSTPIRGILLNQKQMAVLVKDVFQRIETLNMYKRDASVEVDIPSLLVTLRGDDTEELTFKDLADKKFKEIAKWDFACMFDEV